VASVDGMRFVVPVQTINARHNSHYWGQRRGATWLDMINDHAPQLADLPDQKLWRIDTKADYGPFTTTRGRIDLDKVRRNWEDILRVTASVHTGAVRAQDVIRMLSRTTKA
jgi:TnpA family transposase